MKHFIYIFLFSILFLQSQVMHSQCIEITGILVDACGSPEGENEMFTFKTGNNPIHINDISVTWASPNAFLGWCQGVQSYGVTSSLNATITNGCGWLVEPINGNIPPNKNVIAITSLDINTSANSFANLNDTMYVIYQCAGNTGGHFANNSGTPGIRTLTVDISGSCNSSESVSYERNSITGGDGGRVNFDSNGNPEYVNYGCNAPVVVSNTDWSFTELVCNNIGNIDLNTLLNNGSTNGTWSGPNVSNGIYNPSGYIGLDSITYSSSVCGGNQDSTIYFNVIAPSQNQIINLTGCDSVDFQNTTYYNNTIIYDTSISPSQYACDTNIVEYHIDVTCPTSPYNCDTTIIIPNVFTPNNDGKNDVFSFFIGDCFTNISITIYNRWGQEIYSSIYPDFWDGISSGKPVSEGVYYWIIIYEYQGVSDSKKGFIQVLN